MAETRLPQVLLHQRRRLAHPQPVGFIGRPDRGGTGGGCGRTAASVGVGASVAEGAVLPGEGVGDDERDGLGGGRGGGQGGRDHRHVSGVRDKIMPHLETKCVKAQ